jgi:hypothetical protein
MRQSKKDGAQSVVRAALADNRRGSNKDGGFGEPTILITGWLRQTERWVKKLVDRNPMLQIACAGRSKGRYRYRRPRKISTWLFFLVPLLFPTPIAATYLETGPPPEAFEGTVERVGDDGTIYFEEIWWGLWGYELFGVTVDAEALGQFLVGRKLRCIKAKYIIRLNFFGGPPNAILCDSLSPSRDRQTHFRGIHRALFQLGIAQPDCSATKLFLACRETKQEREELHDVPRR